MCRGRLRKQRVRQRLQQTLFGLFGQGETRLIHPEEQVIQNELDSALWQSIRALPEALRLAITLRYYHALPIGEIAQIMQVSQRTVHNRLSDAHSRLRAALEEKVVTE
jgi:RNA polymerase sigma-70 factor (ECF subfamily)